MALIKEHLDIEPVVKPGSTGQFDVFADGDKIATRAGNWLTRQFGAGYPDLDRVVDLLAKHRADSNPK